MNRINLIVLSAIFLLTSTAFSVEYKDNLRRVNYEFSVGGTSITPQENVNDFKKNRADYAANKFEDSYYVILQFYAKPSDEDVHEMRQYIHLIKPITKNTFYVSIPTNISQRKLKKFNVRAIVPISSEMKLDQEIKEELEAGTEKLAGYVVVSKGFTKEFVLEAAEELNIKYSSEIYRATYDMHHLEFQEQELKELIAQPWVLAIRKGL